MKSLSQDSKRHADLRTLIFLCALSLSTLGVKHSQAADLGLVGHWGFDEQGGDAVRDSSTNRGDGAVLGAARVEGKFGGAIKCEQDALVEVPHREIQDHFEDGLTVSAWINRLPNTNWNMIISREVKEGPSEYFGLAVFQNKALFSIDPDGAHYTNVKSANDVPSGVWLHLAGTYDFKTLKLFVNGKLVNSRAFSGVFGFADTNPIVIGGNTNSKGKTWVDCFNGRIDDVRLYKRVLKDEEVASLFVGG
jgi:hypothetical protein